MQLVYGKAAVKMLDRMPPKIAAAVRRSLAQIAAEPFAHHANVQTLVGAPNVFRLRRGDWRAVYRLDRESGRMIVVDIGPRGGIYR